jgi:mono/diheme cytochrome c family protein
MNMMQKKWKKIPSLGVGIAAATLFGLQAGSAFADDAHEVTYAGEVASIINENCVVCHREGGIAPMALTNFEQVRPWAPLIQMKVANREMPPYAYDHDIGNQNLQADWRLSEDEIDTVVG